MAGAFLVTTNYTTGRMSDGSDAVPCVRYEWHTTFADSDYLVSVCEGPVASTAEPAAPTAAEINAVLPADPNGYMLDVFAQLNAIAPGTADSLLARAPTFAWAIDKDNTAVATAIANAALSAGVVTQTEHDILINTMPVHRIL